MLRPQSFVLYYNNEPYYIVFSVMEGELNTILVRDLDLTREQKQLIEELNVPYIGVRYLYLSPLLEVGELKNYLITSNIIEDDCIFWSYDFNIEYTHTNPNIIYNPSSNTSDFTKVSGQVLDMSIFDGGRINISNTKKSLNVELITDTFYTRLYYYQVLGSSELSLKNINMNNSFSSNFKIDDYTSIVKALPSNYNYSIIIKNNNLIYMSGYLTQLTNIFRFRRFMIILYNDQFEPLIFIDERKIYVVDLTFFNTFLHNYLSINPSYQLPERISFKTIYTYETKTLINTQASIYPSIDSYFIYNKAWTSSNIIQTINKQSIIFLSKSFINVHLKIPNDYISLYIASLIIGFNALIPLQSEYLTFGKIKGIYWSRLCQNIKDIVRKPIIKPLITNEDRNKVRDYNKDHVILIDDVAYECSAEVNNTRPYIGFLTKPYELSGSCLPCCFMSSQVNKYIFKKCITDNIVSSLITPVYSLFLIDANRILSNNRLGLLDDHVDNFLNVNAHIKVSNKLLIECKNYLLASGNNIQYIESTIIEDGIIDYLDNNRQHVIIYNTTFYVSPYLEFEVDVTYMVLLKDLLFEVISVSKNPNNDTLIIKNTYRANALIIKNELFIPNNEKIIINNFIIVNNTQSSNIEVLTKSNESNSVHIVYKFNNLN